MSSVKNTWEKMVSVVEPQINAEGIHVYPFDPTFPIDMRFFAYAGGDGARLNRHDYFELIYIQSGEVSFQIQDRIFEAHQGDLIVVGADLYHRVRTPRNIQVKMALIFFEPELIRATVSKGEDMEYLLPFLVQDPDFPHIVGSRSGIPAEVCQLMHRMRAEFPPASNQARLAVKTYLKMILFLLVKHYSEYLETRQHIGKKQAELARLRPLFKHMEQHIGDRISVQDAARICALSSSHFMAFFKRATGQSFVDYLVQLRVARAQWLLAFTDKQVVAVGEEVAFCSQSYFAQVFRQRTGMSPLEYRRKAREIGGADLLTDHMGKALPQFAAAN